ncbi:MAG: hypothetical protein F6K41_22705 [Symploca sp. SIO3E6]|nr:hypothetical protein [Caldora sp. SIO3E6]
MMGLDDFTLSTITSLISSVIYDGIRGLPRFQRRKIESFVQDATAEVVKPLLSFLEHEGISKDKQRRLIETCIEELRPLTEEPALLFQGSLDGQKIFNKLYANRDLPQVVIEDGLKDVYTLLCPRIATLLCKVPAVVRVWENEALSENFRRSDEIIDKLDELVKSSVTRWNSYVNLYGIEELVSFEIEDSPTSLGVAEIDDNERQEIRLGQGFRLVYQFPFFGYALLMQGINSTWVFTRLSKCKNSALDKKTNYIQERIARVTVDSWSVPTNGRYLREKVELGLHRFVLLLSQKPFSETIQEIIFQETNELSSSALRILVEYVESEFSSIKLIVAECDIIR